MAFALPKTQPSGVLSLVHEVVKVEILAATARAQVNSFATPQDYRGTPKVINAQTWHPIPVASAADAQAWLISAEGAFKGATVLSEPVTLEEKRQALLAAATAQRWMVETGGLILPDGTRVLTGKADQDRITSVLVNATAAGIEEVDFKADSGWKRLSLDAVRGIACLIARHVQQCFTAERTHHEAIAALPDLAAIAAYDVAQGWPPVDLRLPAEPEQPEDPEGDEPSNPPAGD
ncbi:DUF4376 domain-containing protein [Variovorax sp.]|uniref:DUF4376 domain-containing protein n=1 Tax=Variovorax sp. TaxID=1871043 RepID=UPI003BA87A4A